MEPVTFRIFCGIASLLLPQKILHYTGTLTTALCCIEEVVFHLKCSSKVLARAKLKKESLVVAGSTAATLGNWCVTMFSIDGTNVFVYMSERSLLSFMLAEGERITPEKLAMAFQNGLYQTLKMEGFKTTEIDCLLAEGEVGMFSRLDNASVTGMLTAIAEYYRYLIEEAGGLRRCSIDSIVHHVNSTPRKPIGFTLPVEATRELVRSAAT